MPSARSDRTPTDPRAAQRTLGPSDAEGLGYSTRGAAASGRRDDLPRRPGPPEPVGLITPAKAVHRRTPSLLPTCTACDGMGLVPIASPDGCSTKTYAVCLTCASLGKIDEFTCSECGEAVEGADARDCCSLAFSMEPGEPASGLCPSCVQDLGLHDARCPEQDRCQVCHRETGAAYARRTGDYEGATSAECGGCERLVCGRCGSWDYCTETGASASCDLPDCEALSARRRAA